MPCHFLSRANTSGSADVDSVGGEEVASGVCVAGRRDSVINRILLAVTE
jgi:hypothetical protein